MKEQVVFAIYITYSIYLVSIMIPADKGLIYS